MANPAAAVPGCPAPSCSIPIPEPLHAVQPRGSPGGPGAGRASGAAFLPSFLPSQGSGWEKPFGRPGWAGAAPLRSPRPVLRAALHKGAGAPGAGARRHRLRPARLGTERLGAVRDGAAPRGRRVSLELGRGAPRGRSEPPRGHRGHSAALRGGAGTARAGLSWGWDIAGVPGQVPSVRRGRGWRAGLPALAPAALERLRGAEEPLRSGAKRAAARAVGQGKGWRGQIPGCGRAGALCIPRTADSPTGCSRARSCRLSQPGAGSHRARAVPGAVLAPCPPSAAGRSGTGGAGNLPNCCPQGLGLL